MRDSRPRRLSPFKRTVVVALIAALVGAVAARIAGAVVSQPAENADLGAFLFGIGVQAVVSALVWPLADRVVPAAAPPEADDDLV